MKMTGAQEQKMKCICWELTTVDFEIRYDLYNNWNLGECSALSAKNKIFDTIEDKCIYLILDKISYCFLNAIIARIIKPVQNKRCLIICIRICMHIETAAHII